MKHALVIGGSGFVGSHLVESLLHDGWSVQVVDNLSTGRAGFLPRHEKLSLVQADISRPDALARLRGSAAPDVVYQLAAIHHIPTCERDTAKTLEVNVVGHQRVLDHAVAVGARRVVFASTGAVYDENTEGALGEESPLRATNIYGSSKLSGEFLLRRMCEAADIDGVIARIFNVVGPRETNPHLLPDLLSQLRDGVKTVRLGNVFPRRDYVHVADVADALAILGRCSLKGRTEAFNIGSGVEYSVADVVEELGKLAQMKLTVTTDPLKQRRQDRMSQLADITKLSQRTGWSPRRTLRDALVDMWSEAQQVAA